MELVELIQYQGEQRVDSRVIAAHLGVRHKSSYDLIKRYEADFRSVGILAFETEEIRGRGQPEKFALLTEDQAYLLLTYSRNTKKVRALKVNLVMAFREARYGAACQVLAARKEEASKCGRGLANWRYDKNGAHQHVANLREQLTLPIELGAHETRLPDLSHWPR